MTTPGVGPVVALTYRATVDVPARFRKSKLGIRQHADPHASQGFIVRATLRRRRDGSPHDMSGCVTKRGRGKTLLEGDCQGAHPRRCIATRWQNRPNAQFVGGGVCKLDPFQPPKIELIPDIKVSHEREP
jgi:hypothetical protein